MADKDLVEVIQSDRDQAGDYAERRGMTASTIKKYRTGGADTEHLLQSYARYRISLTKEASEKEQELISSYKKLNKEIEFLTKDKHNLSQASKLRDERIKYLEEVLLKIRNLASKLWFGKGRQIVDLVDSTYTPVD